MHLLHSSSSGRIDCTSCVRFVNKMPWLLCTQLKKKMTLCIYHLENSRVTIFAYSLRAPELNFILLNKFIIRYKSHSQVICLFVVCWTLWNYVDCSYFSVSSTVWSFFFHVDDNHVWTLWLNCDSVLLMPFMCMKVALNILPKGQNVDLYSSVGLLFRSSAAGFT